MVLCVPWNFISKISLLMTMVSSGPLSQKNELAWMVRCQSGLRVQFTLYKELGKIEAERCRGKHWTGRHRRRWGPGPDQLRLHLSWHRRTIKRPARRLVLLDRLKVCARGTGNSEADYLSLNHPATQWCTFSWLVDNQQDESKLNASAIESLYYCMRM